MEVVDVAAIPATNRALRQTGFRVQDDALGVKVLFDTQSVAAAAGTRGIVEGEQSRLQFVDAVPALGAGEARREADILAVSVHVTDAGQAVCQPQRRLEGFRQPQPQVVAHLEAIYNHLDTMLLLFLQRGQVVQLGDDAIDAGANKARGPQFLEHVQVLPLAFAHHRCQEHQLAALRQRQHRVHHLADRLGLQVAAVVRAARFSHPGKQQSQVIVDFGDRADGGAGVVRGGLLLDRDRRGQTLNVVHVRLFHHREELPGIGGKRLDIAALAFSIEGIESQR